MTVDTSYQPGVVQIRQNGSLCAVSGTTITIESGATLKIESGGTFTVSGAATIPTETVGSSATAFSPYGLTIFGTTATGASYNLGTPPAAGINKYIVKVLHGATTTSETVLCTGATILNATTAATSVITFANRGWVHLISASTSTWVLLSTVAAKTEVSYS